MKREGRQHGMVKTNRILPSPFNPRPDTRIVTRFDYPPTAGLFTKVSSKPTNHSKFTGRCRTPWCTCCHLDPPCKSKDKTKGTQKHKYYWRVMDQPDSIFSGLSATGMLDLLSDGYVENASDDQVDSNDYGSCNLGHGVCTSQIEFQIDQIEEKYEDEDWCLVESWS